MNCRYLLLTLLLIACARTKVQNASPVQAPVQASAGQQSRLLPTYPDDTRIGSDKPLVTVVALLDFGQQPSRESYARLAALADSKHGRELNVVVKHAMLTTEGQRVFEATLAVQRALGADAGRELLSLISNTDEPLSQQRLADWSFQLSLDHDGGRAQEAAPPSPSLAPQLARAQALAEHLEVEQAPQLYVNGARWVPSSGWEGFQALFKRELAVSRKTRSSKESASEHYARRVHENWTSTAPVLERAVVSPLAGEGLEPSWGSPSAPVTLVAFQDFQCPFCARVQASLEQLKELYGPDKLRLVFKHNPLPFHQQARPAHEAATAVLHLAGQAAFWRYHDLLLENYRTLTPENLESWASEVGVPASKLRAELAGGLPALRVDADQALAKKWGARGTPTFRINGVTLNGAQPTEKFREVIDAQLVQAAKLRQEGISIGDVSAVLTQRQLVAPEAEAAQQPDETDDAVHQVPVFDDDPVLGPNDALVTIIGFIDLQCPFCKRVQPTLKALRKKYGNDLRIVWKDQLLPFHARAKPAAIVARSVYTHQGNQAFWQVVDRIFAAQPKLDDATLRRIVESNGGSWRHAQTALNQGSYASKFQQTKTVSVDFKALGSPHFFINGVRISGAQPQEQFETLIDAELEKARALMKRGVPRSNVFETLMQAAQGPPEPETRSVAAAVGKAPVRGSANAKVVIQVFSNFQCSFCKRANPTIEALLRAHPRQLQVVWRYLPLPIHNQAELTAQAAHEVFLQLGNPGFWKYHDELFKAQGQPGGLERPNLETLAQQLGVNMQRFRAALNSNQHQNRVRADKNAAYAANITGTPSFLIGDYYVRGAQPEETFERLIQRVLTQSP